MTVSEVTIIFVDLAGFTAYTQKNGDIAAVGMIRRFRKKVGAIARDHGLSMVSARGDEVLLTTGECAHALEAAVRMVHQINADEGFLPVRIGMHVGRVVRYEGDVFGHAINLAGRVLAAASGGGLLATVDVIENARSELMHALGVRSFRFKGMSEPTEVVQVVVADGKSPSLTVHEHEFVGRATQ